MLFLAKTFSTMIINRCDVGECYRRAAIGRFLQPWQLIICAFRAILFIYVWLFNFEPYLDNFEPYP
jgi:hypothetical protein